MVIVVQTDEQNQPQKPAKSFLTHKAMLKSLKAYKAKFEAK